MNFIYKKSAIILIVALFVLDRFLKVLALNGFETNILGTFFRFDFAPNYFISFSLPLTGPVLTAGVAIIIALLLYKLSQRVLAKNIDRIFILLFALIAGGISNLIDRLRYGFVVDYLDLQYFTVFNIADAMIVVSALILILAYKKQSTINSPL